MNDKTPSKVYKQISTSSLVNKVNLKSKKGITLIALIVTIIVLTILASITISFVVGKNNIINTTKSEQYNAERRIIVEKLRMELLEKQKEVLETLDNEQISKVLEKHGKVNYTENGDVEGVIVNEKFDIKLSEIWDNKDIKLSIEIEAEAYSGIYDGKAHDAIISITTKPRGVKIEYALEGEEYRSIIPQVTEENIYTVSIRASREGYVTKIITKTVYVNKDTTPPDINLTQTNTTTKEYQKTVSVSAIDNESGISVIKYAPGNRDISYFENNGTVLSKSTFDVSIQDYTTTILEKDISNIVYTVYAKNKSGAESIKTITISNLLIEYTMKYGTGSVYANGATSDLSGNITLPEYNSVQFGPYCTFPAGKYEISYYGSNLSKLRYISYTNSTGDIYHEETVGISCYTINLTNTTNRVEFVAYNNTSETVVITEVRIKQLDSGLDLYNNGKASIEIGDEFTNWNKATGNYVNIANKYIELVCPNNLAIVTFKHLLDYNNYKYLYLIVNKEISEPGTRTIVRSDYPHHVNDSSYTIAELTSPGIVYSNSNTAVYKFDISNIKQSGYFCVSGWNGANNGLKIYELYMSK